MNQDTIRQLMFGGPDYIAKAGNKLFGRTMDEFGYTGEQRRHLKRFTTLVAEAASDRMEALENTGMDGKRTAQIAVVAFETLAGVTVECKPEDQPFVESMTALLREAWDKSAVQLVKYGYEIGFVRDSLIKGCHCQAQMIRLAMSGEIRSLAEQMRKHGEETKPTEDAPSDEALQPLHA